jgi:hypothetical protein
VVESSADGQAWKTLADHREAGLAGSPVVIETPATVRSLRIGFPAGENPGPRPAIFEWTVE